MSSIEETSEDTLITRGMQLDLKDINSQLTEQFKEYSISLGRIMGNDLFGNTQVMQIQDGSGVSIGYDKGTIKVKNSIDKLKYIIEHRGQIADIIGVPSSEIYRNRRQYGQMTNYIRMLDSKYEIGDPESDMQMYISKHDDNVSQLDSTIDWVDYILTENWVRKLADASIDKIQNLQDHRIVYLVDMLQGMMKDHEIDIHGQGQDDIDFSEYMDNPDDAYQEAFNRLNSFSKLQYGFYEIYKPIGGSSEKYVKVNLRTNGVIEISGLVELKDCEHIEWEYGSKEYLRSLNTGNQRYDFKISLPFNDTNSVLWWKPDNKELLPDQEEVEKEEDKKYRYYKPYETERFLRWFGTTYVPLIDLDDVVKKTVCQPHILSNDAQNREFFRNADNLMSADLSGMNIDNQTSLSLLSLAPKSTIDIIQKEDGQYLRFVVSGHQQTSTLAFKVRGKVLPVIQEKNHYYHTLEAITRMYVNLTKYIMFLELTRTMKDDLSGKWEKDCKNNGCPEKEYIPSDWIVVQEQLGKIMWTPTFVDLIRFRYINYEALEAKIDEQYGERYGFLGKNAFVDKNLEDYIFLYRNNFDINNENEEIAKEEQNAKIRQTERLNAIGLSDTVKGQITTTLDYLEQAKGYIDEISFETTVDEIRERIQTYNNLVVRLPANSKTNKFVLKSKHIWQDWKAFVDKSLAWLVAEGLRERKTNDKGEYIETEEEYANRPRLYALYDPAADLTSQFGNQKTFTCTATDGREYQFVEHYVDEGTKEPLIDYSYCTEKVDEITYKAKQNDDGTWIGDRWDAWSESDFEGE